MLVVALCLAVTVVCACISQYCFKTRPHLSLRRYHANRLIGLYFFLVALFCSAVTSFVIFHVLIPGGLFDVG